VEAIFSFVFGDGDPNKAFEERRWRALGRRIQQLGGVVSAEELAPFLDPPALQPGGAVGEEAVEGEEGWSGGGGGGRGGGLGLEALQGYQDESFVLPALIRFEGEPVVDEAGQLLYRFPQLQASAGAGEPRPPGGRGGARGGAAEARSDGAAGAAAVERRWEFSSASSGQQLGVALLAAVNCVGVVMLSSSLALPGNQYLLARAGYGFVLGLMPALQTYAAAFAAIPALRYLWNGSRNAAIDARNAARGQAAQLLRAAGGGGAGVGAVVREKMAAARALGQRRVVRQGDVVFDSGKAADGQLSELELEEFDSKLRSGGGR
jgi:hypothetical protein